LFSWFLPERLVIDAPLLHKAKATGAVRLEASLDDVHQRLWESQKIIFFFIGLDALVLVVFGAYIFSKLVVKPVQELVKTTESFREGDRLPDLSAGEQNELSKLSEALNRMLERLASNKEELRQHIVSLEQANLELKRAQREVIMTEKLASVGRLAAGVAHEIGNPIGIVLGYLDLLQRADVEESERRELVSRMGKEIGRIHQIIRELLDFTRSGSTERTTVSLHELIRETLSILDHQFRKQKIEVIQSLAAQPDRVFANADQLKQVFLNLLVNAVDAISSKGGGGELRLSTRTTAPATAKEGEGEPLRRRTDPPSTDYRHLRHSGGDLGGSWIEIQIADSGEGIAEENLDQVFDPFFTTKEPGKGTGLGLSVSAQIVEAMGGWLEISSNHGEGTTVTLLLPAEESRETTEDSRE
ncbi:MAG: sensor histidine kinase, partial [Syntrophobacteria bacterium]